MVKNPPDNIEGTGSITGSGRSLGGWNGNQLLYSCLENPVDREARQVTVHYRLIAKSQTQPRLSKHTCTPKGDQKSIFNVCVYVSVFMLLYFYNFLTLNTFSYLSWLLQFKMHTHTHTHTHTQIYVHTKSPQLCLTLCKPMDYSLPGSSVHGILQTQILEWFAMPSSRDILNPGIEPASVMLGCRFFTTNATWEAHIHSILSGILGSQWN